MTIKDVEEIKDFSYKCNHCGKLVHLNNETIKNYIIKMRNWNLDDDEIIDFFRDPYYNLCEDCGDYDVEE